MRGACRRRTFHTSARRVMRRFNVCAALRLFTLTSIGALVGFLFTMCIQTVHDLPSASDVCFGNAAHSMQSSRQNAKVDASDFRRAVSDATDASTSGHQSFIYIGVMTAAKYLDTRAVAINQTWGQSMNGAGQLTFFVGDNVAQSRANDMPMVRLPGVGDAYPPQKKSFLMIKYMYDNLLDQFEWFVRADDDVYIRMDKLEVFLRSLNSNRPLFVGQAGLGTPEEYGQLNLGDEENYCMGGPSAVMSRETLKRIGPYVKKCLKNLYTTHEDVELGRCVKRYAGVSCTWAYEMQSIFYNNQSGADAYAHDLNVAEVHHAITLHPLKRPELMRRMHNFVRRTKLSDLRFRSIQLNRDVLVSTKELEPLTGRVYDGISRLEDFASPPTLMRHTPSKRGEIISWDFLTPTVIFCTSSSNCPRHNAESYLRYALNDVVRQTMDSMNKYARQRGRVLLFQDILYGYRRVDPLHGAEYILDILLMYKKFKGRRVSIPVRRHAYLQQSFALLNLIEDIDYRRQLATDTHRTSSTSDVVHFILPLCGRSSIFRRFLSNFERVCLSNMQPSAKLNIVWFASPDAKEDEEILTLLNEYMAKYSSSLISWTRVDAHTPFSRGLGLHMGASSQNSSALLFFTDVDVVFTSNFVRRIRLNTIEGNQVYFPIVYSEYDPRFTSSVRTDHFTSYDANGGYFRHFGFGLTSLFKSDYDAVGGFDLTLKGWGMEDVSLFDKFVKTTNLTVFRAPEPELVHVYHPMECAAKTLNKTQYDMCIGSKAASFASVYALYDVFTSNRTFVDEFLKAPLDHT